MRTLSNANTTAQWYADDYPGAIFERLDKVVLHSTETKSWPGYGGGASAPNCTWHPLADQTRQHFPNLMSSRALRDPSGTAVRENRDNVFQIEVVAFSDYKLAQSVGGLWIGDLTDAHYTYLANMLKELNRYHGVPLTSTVQWKEGQKTYVSGVRLSGPSYDAYRGILAHMHVSGNDHWDVGGFRWSRLAAKLTAPVPPTPTPRKRIPDMYVTKFGRSAYRLITGDRIVSISKDAYETFVRAGLPHETLDNADIEALQTQLKYEGE